MRRLYLIFITTGLIFINSFVIAQDQQPLKLWYTQPAEKWTEALPIGNGRLGAMIFGGVNSEHLQFNEETLWTGGPRPYHRDGAVKYLQPIRQLLFEGKQAEAEELAGKYFMGRKSDDNGYEAQKSAWLQKVRANQAPAAVQFNDHDWKEMKLPLANGWETAGLEGEDGALWFRNTFEVPEAWAGKNLVINLGRIRDLDYTYINGKQIGSTDGIGNTRRYKINASLLKAGKNVIAVQVLNFYDKGGMVGAKGNQVSMAVYPEGDSLQNALALNPLWKYWIQNNTPPVVPQFQASYQPFADVWLQAKSGNPPTDYRRELDLGNAVSTVSYTMDGVRYTREYFVSAPDQVIVMHLTADQPGKISLTASLQSPHKLSSTKKIDNHTLGLSLQVRNGVLKGTGYLQAEASSGTIHVTNDKIVLENASEVTFYLAAGTSYKTYKDVSGNPEAICTSSLLKIKNKKYAEIKAAHIREYKAFFNTFSLNLGQNMHSGLPTNERIAAFEQTFDPSLITLYLQYGRYLLISSSRPGTNAANLQGIWNNLLTPPWGSKYTTNINLQMNYWPAEILNLSTCNEPLFRLIDEAAEAGKLTAKAHYDAPGWVLHHNTDLWRGTAPINASNHGIWVTGAAWLTRHLWEHYLFTQDKHFLQSRAYPVMKEAARFFVKFLSRDPKTGWLISTPSNSPEQGGLVAGPSMDHQIIRELFTTCITASEILQSDQAFREILKEKYKQVAPNQVGKFGQLQEWLEDRDDTTNKHRHVSHLWGVFPGTDISWQDSPDMMKAARQSLLYRGDEGTGWSLAWKVNLWARFKDGDHSMRMAKELLKSADDAAGGERGGVYLNLFDAHPPFQIDGNFGGAAGIAEMLLQSQSKFIELLPALPAVLPAGEIRGICARGGFVLNFAWKNGQLEQVEINSMAGKDCFLKYGNKEINFPTEMGKTYKLDGELKQL